jgi:hypothetical protein
LFIQDAANALNPLLKILSDPARKIHPLRRKNNQNGGYRKVSNQCIAFELELDHTVQRPLADLGATRSEGLLRAHFTDILRCG